MDDMGEKKSKQAGYGKAPKSDCSYFAAFTKPLPRKNQRNQVGKRVLAASSIPSSHEMEGH